MVNRNPPDQLPLKVLVVDDDGAVCELAALYARESGFREIQSAGSAEDGLKRLAGSTVDLVILDLGLPDRPGSDALAEFLAAAGEAPVAVVTADGRSETAVRCLRAGAFDYIEKPIAPARLISLFGHAGERSRGRAAYREASALSPAFDRIVTRSPLMYGLFESVRGMASSPLPVLILGESGTGKELIASAIHTLSGRAGEFVAVNVAGLDGSLFSDVLFGHAKGAYTGAASARPGLIRRASGGTLFLDEIGDLSHESQVKLLRFIQEGEYYPLGSDKAEIASCRLVVATHAELREAVRLGRFRADLYYRLMPHIARIPPLRDRPEDVQPLAEHFAAQTAALLGLPPPSVGAAFVEALRAYDFPGNVRELGAIIAGALSDPSEAGLSLAYARGYIERQRASDEPASSGACPDYGFNFGERFPTLSELEAAHIREALRRCGGNQSAAARMLGVAQSTISRKLAMKEPDGAD